MSEPQETRWTDADEPRLTVVALGSNLGESRRIIREAMSALQQHSEIPLRRSSLWASEPVNCPSGSAWFVNAICVMQPHAGVTPEDLLGLLQQLERQFGRTPKRAHNEPRVLDLDLIAFGRERRNTPELVLPHPRAHLRRFVLQPLAEIIPDYRLPGERQTITELLRGLPPDIQRVQLVP